MSVLIIEPDTVLADIYQKAFVAENIDVATAATAQSAISYLDQNTVELIILELQIANHNGIEFIHELRSYPEWKGLPIVLHTFVPPDSMQGSHKIFKSLGIRSYLYKPSTSLQKLISVATDFVPALP